MDDNKFTDAELELMLEGLNELEENLGNGNHPGEILSGILAAGSKEEAEAMLKDKMEKAKTESRLKRRSIILLKAKLVEMQAESEVARFFAPTV
jgi:hypothetical protein